MKRHRRRQAVLHLVVEAYLENGEPIGSKAIAAALGPSAPSSATIRADLSQLGEEGLVTKPHASSGRVPTELGLRDYIDHGLRARLHPWDRNRLDSAAGATRSDLPVQLSQMLAGLTGQLAVVAVPRMPGSSLREIGLVRAAPSRFIAFFVSGTGTVQQKLVEADFDLSETQLQTVQNMLNERLQQLGVAELRRAIRRELVEGVEQRDILRTRALQLGAEALPEPEIELVVQGAAHLVSKPELADLQQLHRLLRAVEERRVLLEIMDQVLDEAGVQVLLGSEHHVNLVEDLTCVGGTLSVEEQMAAVSVFGPSRMNYNRLVPLVGYATELLGKYWDT